MNTPIGSASYRKRNPHLFPDQTPINLHGKWGFKVGESPKPQKRIRQSSKPILNKLEQEWYDWLLDHCQAGNSALHEQAITFKLANGLRYTPDLFAFEWQAVAEFTRPTAWEVKGPWFTDDANAKLKMFAHQYPEIRVILAWKEKSGQWLTQRILP